MLSVGAKEDIVMIKNLVFIDRRVNNYQVLVQGLSPEIAWVLLDPEQDGVQQMQAAVQGYTGHDSIHIVSHGSAGALHLGSTVLDRTWFGSTNYGNGRGDNALPQNIACASQTQPVKPRLTWSALRAMVLPCPSQ